MLNITSISLFLIETAIAQNQLRVNIGPRVTFFDFAGKMIQTLSVAMGSVSIAIFIIGAFLYLASGAKEDLRDKGKSAMIGSLIGLMVTLSAFILLRMAFGIFGT